MGQTLEQRVRAMHQLSIDNEAKPYPRISCWCGQSLAIDWDQGVMEMYRWLTTFISEHKACKPKEQA